MNVENHMVKRDVEELIGKLEDAMTTVDEAREAETDPEQETRLEEVQEVLEETTDTLEEQSDND